MLKLRKKCICPTCNVPVQVKGLHKNLTFSTLVACTSKLKDLLELRAEVESSKTFLNSILDADSIDETQMPEMFPEEPEELKPTKASDLFATFQALDQSDQETQLPEPEEPEPELVEPKTKRLARRSANSSVKVTPVAKSPSKTRMKTPKSVPVEKVRKEEPQVAQKSEPIKILMSGLKPDDKDFVEEYYKKVQKGVKVQIAHDYDPKTINRVIVGTDDAGLCTRTTKYLRGVLDGKAIVTFSWFWDSFEKKQWLDPAAYLVKGDTSISRETNAVKASLERSMDGKLFADYSFYLVGKFKTPSKEDLTTLLKSGGAKVLTARLPASESALPDNHLVIYDPDLLDDESLWITDYAQRTSSLWVLDCISSYEILPTY